MQADVWLFRPQNHGERTTFSLVQGLHVKNVILETIIIFGACISKSFFVHMCLQDGSWTELHDTRWVCKFGWACSLLLAGFSLLSSVCAPNGCHASQASRVLETGFVKAHNPDWQWKKSIPFSQKPMGEPEPPESFSCSGQNRNHTSLASPEATEIPDKLLTPFCPEGLSEPELKQLHDQTVTGPNRTPATQC